MMFFFPTFLSSNTLSPNFSYIGLNHSKANIELPPEKNDNTEDTNIGNSFFKGNSSKTVSISQLGVAYEGHQSYSHFYAFFNKLCANQIYYELRAYFTYHYISQNPPSITIVPNTLFITDEKNPLGTGGSGILGYQFFINSKVSFMPFIRVQDLSNTMVAYEDKKGNALNSVNYTGYLGAKLSMAVNDNFAIYSQFYGGYDKTILSGRGIFNASKHPTFNAAITVLEFGTPYRIQGPWSITPYFQLVTVGYKLDSMAQNKIYALNPLTNSSSVFALKVGYKI